MEKMPGRPLDWQGATPVQKEMVLQQPADINIEIEKHLCEAMGSLMKSGSPPVIQMGGIAHYVTY